MPKPRNGNNKTLKPKLHIFCEGEKTEPIYLNGYIDKFHSSIRRLDVLEIKKTNKNTPIQLVEEAIKLKESKDIPDHDIFWVVYDREAKSKYTDSLHQKALDLASRENINVSLTNVCFEVWLLLHMRYSDAPYTSFDNLLNESPFKTELKKLGITKYKKADETVFNLISNSISEARERAEKMNKATLKISSVPMTKPHLLNPFTGIHYLLDAIDEVAQKT